MDIIIETFTARLLNFAGLVCGGVESYGLRRSGNLFPSHSPSVKAYSHLLGCHITAPNERPLKRMMRNMVGTSKLISSDGRYTEWKYIPENESSAGAVPSTNETSKVRAPKTQMKTVTTLCAETARMKLCHSIMCNKVVTVLIFVFCALTLLVSFVEGTAPAEL